MKKPSASVVIAVRNRIDYLIEAILSIQNQTLEDWECIVVDDNSSQDIQGLLATLQDTRFVYTKNKRRAGIAGARNTGNNLAKADIVVVADSDDLNLPRRLEVTTSFLNDNPDIEITYANMYIFHDKKYDFTSWQYIQPYFRADLYTRNFIPHPASAYRKSVVLPIGYNEQLESAVDYELWLSLADLHTTFAMIEEPLVLYRRHPDQILSNQERRLTQTANAARIREYHAQFI